MSQSQTKQELTKKQEEEDMDLAFQFYINGDFNPRIDPDDEQYYKPRIQQFQARDIQLQDIRRRKQLNKVPYSDDQFEIFFNFIGNHDNLKKYGDKNISEVFDDLGIRIKDKVATNKAYRQLFKLLLIVSKAKDKKQKTKQRK